MIVTDKLVNDVYTFIRPRYLQAEESTIKSLITRHLQYGTCDVIRDLNGSILAVVRWNITQDGLVCDVLDLFIRPGELGTRIIKHLIARNWGRFPTVKYIRFARVIKYPRRTWRVYRIEDILNLRRKHVRF